MSLVMCSRVTFPASRGREELNIFTVSEVKIESSWKMLTGTAEIVFPRKTRDFREKDINELFREGDPVEVLLGYNGDLYTEFTGYVTTVSAGIPVKLRCEDEMFALKRKTVNVSLQSTTLEKLLKAIAPGYDVECYDVEIGSVRYSGVTAAQVLEDITRKTGLRACFIDGVLHCGKISGERPGQKPVNVFLEKNAVSEELNNTNNGEVKIQVKAVSILKGGKKLEVNVGDSGGTTKRLSYVGITVKAELEKRAMEDLERLKKRTREGSIVLFGLPRVISGQAVKVTSEICPGLNGTYHAGKVTKEFSDNATYRQKIELGDERK